jgi:hypothetical protein
MCTAGEGYWGVNVRGWCAPPPPRIGRIGGEVCQIGAIH